MGLLSRPFELYRERSFSGLVRSVGFATKHTLMYLHYKIVPPHFFFVFRGKRFGYATYWYSHTFLTERHVEVSIGKDFLKRHKGERILEIGNVLSHYFPDPHTIVDKYEIAPGVINEDVISYAAKQKFDAIISISTLEHVGYEERPMEPKKILSAIENLKRLVKKGGEILITVPIGYNPYLDKMLKTEELKFTEEYYLRRTSERNDWVQTDKAKALKARFDSPFQAANAILVGIIRT